MRMRRSGGNEGPVLLYTLAIPDRCKTRSGYLIHSPVSIYIRYQLREQYQHGLLTVVCRHGDLWLL